MFSFLEGSVTVRRAVAGLILLVIITSPLSAKPQAASQAQLQPQPPGSTGPRAPGALSSSDAAAIRKVIEAQLNALQADDAERAYSYASPSIRRQFGSAANFLEMMRIGYPVVHLPASVRFLALKTVQDTIAQAVRMTDAEGLVWLAFYTMERQPDGNWRIGGCQVVRDDSLQT